MENKISRKDAKQLIQRAKNAVKSNENMQELRRNFANMLIDCVNPSNCSLADQDMLEDFIQNGGDVR